MQKKALDMVVNCQLILGFILLHNARYASDCSIWQSIFKKIPGGMPPTPPGFKSAMRFRICSLRSLVAITSSFFLLFFSFPIGTSDWNNQIGENLFLYHSPGGQRSRKLHFLGTNRGFGNKNSHNSLNFARRATKLLYLERKLNSA